MILAQLESRNIQLSVMARHFSGPAKSDSAFKRIQRFINEVSLPSDAIARLMLAIFGLCPDEKLVLIFDRTNWKFGKIHLNILYLSIIHNGASIPLFFRILEDKKQGNSNYIDRIALLEKFIALLGRSRIKFLLGDREFAGKHWIVWLRKMKVPFVIRIPEKTTKIAIDNEDFITINQRFNDLKIGRKRFLGYCLIGETDSYKASVSVLRSYKKELVVVVHSDDIKNPLSCYKERWKIESMFRLLKTGGFNLENTHVTAPKRIANLLSVLGLAYCFALKAGRLVLEDTKVKLKKNGYMAKSLVRLGLDALFDWLRMPERKTGKKTHKNAVFRLEKIFVL
jgi:hypothetical protein